MTLIQDSSTGRLVTDSIQLRKRIFATQRSESSHDQHYHQNNKYYFYFKRY